MISTEKKLKAVIDSTGVILLTQIIIIYRRDPHVIIITV